jgi:hypothetical protein
MLIEELNKSHRPYLIAFAVSPVQGFNLVINSAKEIIFGPDRQVETGLYQDTSLRIFIDFSISVKIKPKLLSGRWSQGKK